MHNELCIAKILVYDKCGFDFTELVTEDESQEYGASTFRLNRMKVKFRISKITPTKTGQFVTIWKRNQEGITQPLDLTDEIDFVVISSRNGDNFGQFIFSKSLLLDKGIMTANKEGKRGIRVYPPWDTASNKQAEKTQSWQIKYFLTIHKDNSTDLALTKKLFLHPNEI
ncbi:MAG: MepB family protein [Sphingobacteriales bacterium]